MKAYFISGLAADSRVFKYIQLPEGFETVYLDWIAPLKKESLKEYALRMAGAIDTREPFVLLGLSMGGMIVSEISKALPARKTILVSSVPDPGYLPFYFKAAGSMRLYKIIPVSALKWAARTKRLFTRETSEDKKMILQLIQESDTGFINWAVEAILHWKATSPPANYIHIHGSKDEVLPMRFTKPTHPIKNAGHLMVMTHARQINRIISEELTGL